MGNLIGPLYLVLGFLMLCVAYLCFSQRLKRNRMVGMRTRATLASDDAWYAAHRASAWSLAVAAVILLAVGIWVLATQPGESAATTAVMGSAMVVLLVVVIGGIQADRVAKSVLN